MMRIARVDSGVCARWLGLSLILCLASSSAGAPPPLGAGAGSPRTLATLLLGIESSWRARDLDAYLALWQPADVDRVAEERGAVQESFASANCSIFMGRVGPDPDDASIMTLHANTFCVREPLAQLARSRFRLAPSPQGWHVAGREVLGQPERLAHLSLAPQGFRARGHTLRLEDFELRMDEGTIFLPPPEIGPTALAFVGKGVVRFTPRPAAEREQLRQYSGRTELVTSVKSAFVRLNPWDFEQLVQPAQLEPDPEAALRFRRARGLFEDSGRDVYRLDTNMPGSPWWAMPPPEKAVVVFERGGRMLTFGVAAQPESISLFDRSRSRYICLYPAGDQASDYYEDSFADFDILHHDLRVKLEPDRRDFDGEDVMTLKLRAETANLYLRLSRDLVVRSVTSTRAGHHLYFRTATQGLLVVSLGGYARVGEELTLTVSYSGTLNPSRSSDEPLQITESQLEEQLSQKAPLMYSNSPAWYPQSLVADYATANLVVELPAGYEVVSGGVRVSSRREGDRHVVEYRQGAPSRYLTMVVGRLVEAGRLTRGPLALQGFAQPEMRTEVPELLERSIRVLQFYETLFGPCPYPLINVTYTEGATPGGHSPPGMTILSRRSLRLQRLSQGDPGDFSDFEDFFLAHELAHQWWGHGVAPANYRERWLSEAFAHYAAALWIRQAQGDRVFARAVERMAHWAERESDRGPINLGQRLGQVEDRPPVYRAVVYDKGALVLHMLRGILGDGPFFDGLRRLQANRRFQLALTDDLAREWEEAAGRSMSVYLERWIRTTALPTLLWRHETVAAPGSWRTTVAIEAEHVPGPLPVEITLQLPTSVERRQVTVPPEGGAFTFETAARPLRVRLNDNNGLLARVKTKR